MGYKELKEDFNQQNFYTTYEIIRIFAKHGFYQGKNEALKFTNGEEYVEVYEKSTFNLDIRKITKEEFMGV
ncbi:MAG: hypothetical protein PWQ45_142 [Thermosipho sp. (in: thermotogales)]|nr:hypothetical protein [Thermosipho sp. (in: thermotogales)]